jgi:hypothetical protein
MRLVKNQISPPTLERHHEAFGFVARSPYHWQTRIYTDKAQSDYQLLDYYPTTGKVVYVGQTYQMEWPALAKALASEQRNFLGHLR